MNSNHLKQVLTLGLFLTLLIPFCVAPPQNFPYVLGKGLFFYGLMLILFPGWIILIWKQPSFRPHRTCILGAITLFMIIIGFADLFGAHLSQSFWSNHERMEGYITLLFLWMYFLMLTTIFTETAWVKFWHGLVVISVLLNLIGVYQWVHDLHIRIDATFGNAAYFATYLLFCIFITAILWRKYNKYHAHTLMFRQVFYVLALGLQLFGLYHTATRGAIFALFTGILISAITLLFLKHKPNFIHYFPMGLILTVGLLVGGFFVVKDFPIIYNNPVLGRFTAIADSGSGESRLQVWKAMEPAVHAHPYFGWGQHNFEIVFYKYKPKNIEGRWDHPHNIVLEWLIAGGIFGLISYLLIFISASYTLWSHPELFTGSERAGFSGLLMAYFFQNLFLFDTLTSYLLFFAVLAYLNGKTYLTES